MKSDVKLQGEQLSDQQQEYQQYRKEGRNNYKAAMCLLASILVVVLGICVLVWRLAVSLQTRPTVLLPSQIYSYPAQLFPAPINQQLKQTAISTIGQSFVQLQIGQSSPQNAVQVHMKNSVQMAYQRAMRELDYNNSIKMLQQHQEQTVGQDSGITIKQYLQAVQLLQLTTHPLSDVSKQLALISHKEQVQFQKIYNNNQKQASICVAVLLSRRGLQTGSYHFALRSIFQQKYRNFRVVIVDNNPQMNMQQDVVNLLKEISVGRAVILDRIKGHEYGQSGAFYYVLHQYCKESQITVVLRDRGQLIGQTVLSKINQAHALHRQPLVVSGFLLDQGKTLVQLPQLRYKVPLYQQNQVSHKARNQIYSTKYLKSYKTKWLLQLPQSAFQKDQGSWLQGLFEAELQFALQQYSCHKYYYLSQLLYMAVRDDIQTHEQVRVARRQHPLQCKTDQSRTTKTQPKQNSEAKPGQKDNKSLNNAKSSFNQQGNKASP